MAVLYSFTTLAADYEATLYAEPVTITTENTAMMAISMKNSFDVSAFAFWVELPEGVSIAEELNEDNEMTPMVLLSSRKKYDHMLFFNQTVTGGRQIACLSGDLKTFRDYDGELIYITLKADKNMEPGNYNIHISNISFSDVSGTSCIQNVFDIPLTVTKTDCISNVAANKTGNRDIYTINGIKVNNTNDRGIYITNNKKFVKSK